MTLPNTIPLSRYRLRTRLLDAVVLPDYAGGLLRSVFGASLRRITCQTHQATCGSCALISTCPYTQVFEALPPTTHRWQKFSNIPNAYVIEPPSRHAPLHYGVGDVLQFGMVLTGAALDQLPLVLYAWHQALQHGLTASHSRAELVGVDWMDADGKAHPVWHSDFPEVMADHPATLCLPQKTPQALAAITLNIHTPMRLQSQGQPLFAQNLRPHVLLAALARRISLVMEFHAQQPAWSEAGADMVRLAESLDEQRDLYWYDWTRYSSRQKQEMALGGVLGRWTLLAPPHILDHLWPWLWLGQWLHVGKNATMGMGAYTLESTYSVLP